MWLSVCFVYFIAYYIYIILILHCGLLSQKYSDYCIDNILIIDRMRVFIR